MLQLDGQVFLQRWLLASMPIALSRLSPGYTAKWFISRMSVLNLGSTGELFDRLGGWISRLDHPLTDDENQQLSSLVQSIADAFGEERTKRTSAESILAAMELKCRSLTDRLKGLPKEEPAVEVSEPAKLPIAAEAFQEEKGELLRVLQKKDSEIQSLNEENDRLNEKLKGIWKETKQLEEEFSDAKTKLNLSAIQQSSLQNEISRLESGLKEREEELAFVQNSFNEYRKLKTKYIVELEGKVDVMQESSQSGANQLSQQRQRILQMETSMEEMQQTIRNLKSSLLEQEESFKSELASQIRLAEVYRKNAQDMSDKLLKLEELHASMEGEMEEKENELKAQLDGLVRENGKLSDRLRERDAEMEKFKSNIESNFIASISPTAGVLERVSKSGKSFSEIYAEYLQLQQDYLREKHERENLKDCLDEMLKDIEANAPLVKNAKQELQSARNEIATLLVQLNEAKEESEQLARQNDVLSTKTRSLETDSQLKDQQIEDLSRQVQVLLVELGETSSEQLEPNTINERLVDVKNVADLQEKNQNLLRMVRELSAQIDDLKQRETLKSSNVEVIQMKLEETLREVENLREVRKKQTEMISEYLNKMEKTEDKHELKHQCHAQSMFDDFKRETNQTIAQLNEQIDGFRKENSSLRIESFRIAGQIELLTERNSQLSQKLTQSLQENSRLQSKNDQISNAHLELQQRIVQSNDDLLLAKNELHEIRSKVTALQLEVSMSQSQVKKLENENSILSTEKERLSQLLLNLQIFQGSLESGQTEGKTKLANQLEAVEKELATVRNKLTHELEYSKSLLHNFEREKSEYSRKLQEASEGKSTIYNDLLITKTKNEQLAQQVEFLNKQLMGTENRLSLLLVKQSDTTVEESLDNELTRLRNTIARMHEELKLANGHVEEFKMLAVSNEKALNETTLFANELQTKLDSFEEKRQQQISIVSSQLNEAQDRIVELEKQIVELQQAKMSILKESEQNSEKIAKYNILQEQLAEKENLFNETRASLQKDIQIEQDKYEKEVLAHAKDIQMLGQLKDQLQAASQELKELTMLNSQLKQQSTSAANEWNIQKTQFESSINDLEFKITELHRQNDILLGQIESLSKNVPIAADASVEMDEVVKFLRREKEILTCQNDILVQENRRLVQKATQLTDEVSSVKAALEQEKMSKELDVTLKKEYQALAEKIESANILKESNVTLRAECESYKQKYSALQQEFNTFRSRCEPLEQANRQLQSQIQALQQEIQSLLQDNAMWKSRLDQIIARTDTIEMSKYNELSNNYNALQQRLQEAQSKSNESQSSYSELNEKYVALENRSKKLAQLCQSLKTRISQPVQDEQSKKEFDELKERVTSLEEEKNKLDEKNKRLAAFVQKTSELKEAFNAKLEQELINKQKEWEKKVEDLRAEHELRISLMNSQWKAKLAKAGGRPEEQLEKTQSPVQHQQVAISEPELSSGAALEKARKHELAQEEFPTELGSSSPKRKPTFDTFVEGQAEDEGVAESFDESEEEEEDIYEEENEAASHPSDAEELELEPEEFVEEKPAPIAPLIAPQATEELERHPSEEEEEEDAVQPVELPRRDLKKTIVLTSAAPEAQQPPASSRVIRTSIQRIPTFPATSTTATATSPSSSTVPSGLHRPLKSSTRQTSAGKGPRVGRLSKRGSKRAHHPQ